jgi:hypothetical protein
MGCAGVRCGLLFAVRLGESGVRQDGSGETVEERMEYIF